jgi:hypothetical protein
MEGKRNCNAIKGGYEMETLLFLPEMPEAEDNYLDADLIEINKEVYQTSLQDTTEGVLFVQNQIDNYPI